jgi:hypothetical protein
VFRHQTTNREARRQPRGLDARGLNQLWLQGIRADQKVGKSLLWRVKLGADTAAAEAEIPELNVWQHESRWLEE